MESVRSSPQPSAHARLEVAFERPSAVIKEIAYLTRRHHGEAAPAFQPYSPDWDRYLAYERAGSCVVWTARAIESRLLVGYVVWLLTCGLHCAETMFAISDAVYLSPEWRQGLTGYKLIKSAVDAMRPHADIIEMQTSDLYEDGRMGVLLERLGFERMTTIYQRKGR